MALLIQGGTGAAGERLDVRVGSGAIVEVGSRLVRRPGEEVIAAGGGAVLPGLHDHHVHLRALAAHEASVAAGPPAVRTEEELMGALQQAAGEARGGWVRAVGYHESVAGNLDRWALDRYTAGRPVPIRVQHRSGALWMVNSAAVDALGIGPDDVEGIERDPDGEPTGRLWRADRWLADRLPRLALDMGRVGRMAAALGVTGFTDATPDQRPEDLEFLVEVAAGGDVPQRLHLMAPAGATLPVGAPGLVGLGPVKVMLDDSTLPSMDHLVSIIRAARAEERAVAVHCVTRVQTVLAVAAFEQAGSGLPERPDPPIPPDRPDRLEHGAVIDPALFESIRRLGLTVVTQPGFVAARGDAYLAEVEESDLADLWRAASLLNAGILVAAGTDAPFGPADPWAGVRAAVDRRTGAGRLLGAGERLEPLAALHLWTGHPHRPGRRRRVAAGEPADLCVLADPLDASMADKEPPRVATTIVGGRVVYQLT